MCSHTLLEELHVGPYEELGRLTFARFYERYMWWFYGVLAGFAAVVTVMLYIYRLNTQLREKKGEIERLNENAKPALCLHSPSRCACCVSNWIAEKSKYSSLHCSTGNAILMPFSKNYITSVGQWRKTTKN